MNVTEALKAAILLHLQRRVNPDAIAILDWEQRVDYSCCEPPCYCGPPDVTIEVLYEVSRPPTAQPRRGDAKIVQWWTHEGSLVHLIRRLDTDVLN